MVYADGPADDAKPLPELITPALTLDPYAAAPVVALDAVPATAADTSLSLARPASFEKGPPLPFHTIEGYGGGAITPMAYLVNAGPKKRGVFVSERGVFVRELGLEEPGGVHDHRDAVWAHRTGLRRRSLWHRQFAEEHSQGHACGRGTRRCLSAYV